MKKKLIVLVLSILLCTVLFAGCMPQSTHVFSNPKWPSEEQLVYKVSSVENGTSSENPIIVGNGEYKSTIKEITLDEKSAFELVTEFTFTGKYVSKTFTSEEFTDTINTKCVFYNHRYDYLPVSSERVVKIHELKRISGEDNKFKTSLLEYKTTSTSTFDFEKNILLRVDSTLFGLNKETNEYDVPLKFGEGETAQDKKTEYSYKKPANNKVFFDNEQLFYGVRSIVSNTFGGQMLVVNTVFDGQLTSLSLNRNKDESEGINKETGLLPVTINGKTYSCMLFTLSGGQNKAGIPIKLYYEDEFSYKLDEADYKRNVLVKMVQDNLVFELISLPNYEKI